MVCTTQHFRAIFASCHLLRIKNRAVHRHWQLLDSVVAAMDLLQPHIRELASATRNSAICSMCYRAGVTELASVQSSLRMVPTKYKRFYARLGPCRNRKSLQGLFVSTKKNCGSNVLFTCMFLNKIIETVHLASMKAIHWFS